MENESYFTTFILTEFQYLGSNKHIYFSLALTAYLLIIIFNCSLILLIYVEKHLHEPMYIFLCNLLFSELIGSTTFYVKFMIDLQADTQEVSRAVCFIQNYFVYLYVTAEITILTVMAHDRYIAINFPLHYTVIISTRKIQILIFVAWIFPILILIIGMSLSARLPLCGNQINRVYCANWEIVKLSCTNTNSNNIYGFLLMFTCFMPFIFIIYSYMKILKVCWSSCKSQKYKALQTCLPHLVTLILFLSSVLFEVIESRVNIKRVRNVITSFASLEFLTVPPLLNPIIYGMILPEIRKRVIRILSCTKKRGSIKSLK
ncbi:olfactory receptor 1468-like [Polypterus senegalus]|uniref:olfactory receptor 1468-like n=1 Tax=Polypterus senegalus TaxID=55291 RepID=UPI00196254CD|nr:olfactory receptor 1468-like [Polypterus senegalus]